MQVGDIVSFEDALWSVRKIVRDHGMATLRRWDGQTVEVGRFADKTGKVRVVASPPTDWPYIVTPSRSRLGRITRLTRQRGADMTEFLPLEDWVPADPDQTGGSIFFRPGIVRQGEVIVAHHEGPRSGQSRITIPYRFGTIGERILRATPVTPPPPRTRHERLLDDDLEDK